FRMRVDTAELFDNSGRRSVKLGVGSSAATAVAIDAAVHAAFIGDRSQEAAAETVARLLVPGREAQSNAGSGIDLAAGLSGGLLAYSIRGEQSELRHLALPPEIGVSFVWTGEPASTAELLAAWRRSREKSLQEHDRMRGRMQTVARAGITALEGGNPAEFLACFSDYGAIMGKMNDLVGCEVVTREHRIASGLARQLGGVYKPCGAGGGDLGI